MIDGRGDEYEKHQDYQKGEFCSRNGCALFANLMMGKTSACKRCMAFKFHKYIEEHFEPLKRKGK
jgi:hypothetical protein